LPFSLLSSTRYYRGKKDEEYDMDDLKYGAPPEGDQKSDPAILEKLLANPSAQQDILAGSNDKYDWTQNGHEVEVYVHLDADVSRKEVKCSIEKDSLSIEVRGGWGALYCETDLDIRQGTQFDVFL
jgi:hypothetical protein